MPLSSKRVGTRSLAQLVPSITTTALGRRGGAIAKLITKWPEIVGPAIGQGSLPRKLVFSKGSRSDGTLHLAVASNLATELQHLEPMLLERINGFLGYGAVKKLRLTQDMPAGTTKKKPRAKPAATTEPPPNAAKASSKNDSSLDQASLDQALARLGEAVEASARDKTGPGIEPGK